MGTTRQQPEVHTCERDNRSCSNSMSTAPTRDGTWNLQAAQQQVCHTTWNKEHRVLNKAAQANIWQQQLRGVILQLGIWALKVWERQQHNTTRPNQNCSPDERDIRATATTPAPECRSNTNIRRGTWNNHGVLQSHNSPQQATPATWFIQCLNTCPRRTGTYGHWSCQQRIQRKVQQRKREEAQQRKGKKQRQHRQRIRLRVQQRQRKDWTRNAIQRSAQQRRIHRQRKRQANRQRKRSPNTRMLQMWSARPHSKRLQSGCTQPQRSHRQHQHLHQPMARRPNSPMVSTTILWRPMVEWWPNTGQRTAAATTGTTTTERAGTTSSTTSHRSHFNPALQQASAGNWANSKHYRRTDDWQWSSNTRLSTMVCSNIHNIRSTPWARPKTYQSNRRRHQGLRLQMGVHEEQQATTNHHTLLCVWRVTTHSVSNKTGITGFQHPPQRAHNNHQYQRFRSNTEATTRTIFSYSQH